MRLGLGQTAPEGVTPVGQAVPEGATPVGKAVPEGVAPVGKAVLEGTIPGKVVPKGRTPIATSASVCPISSSEIQQSVQKRAAQSVRNKERPRSRGENGVACVRVDVALSDHFGVTQQP